MIPPVYDENEAADRLCTLIALEIDRIVEDLDVRREFLLEIWGRHRDRGPFLDTVFSRWKGLRFRELSDLPPEILPVLEAFYRELDELRLYFQYTQDMPTTLAETYEVALHRIAVHGALAVEALGGVPERPIVEFEDDEERVSLLTVQQPATE